MLLYLLWWVCWAVLQVFVLHRLGISWEFSLADAGIFSFLLAIACSSGAMIFRFYQPGSASRFYRIVFAIGVTLLFCFLFQCIMNYLYSGDTEYLLFLERSMPLRFDLALMLLSFQVAMTWLLGMLEEQKQLDRHRTEVQALAREAELGKLRQQLQPHFLFNSLNSISALAGSNPSQARKMIQQLSDFLRGTIRKDETRTVTMSEELAQLELYLDIEKVRFGHRLEVNITTEEGCEKLLVPPMLMQPVVENAIKFGLYGTVDSVNIRVAVSCLEKMLIISVTNPFDASESGGSTGTGFGLNSLARRLFLLYGRADLLEVKKNGDTFETIMRLPQ
jgi:two-component system LytT family sensor kinase